LPLIGWGSLYLQENPDDAAAQSTAELLFQRAISAEPGNLGGALRLSGLYATQMRLDEAKAQIDQAKALAPGSGEPYVYEMVYWAQQDKLDEANAAAERAVQLDPTLTSAPDYEASVYSSWRQLPVKTDYYLSLLNTDPEALWLHSILAAFYQRPNQDKPEYAVTYLEKLVSHFPEFAEYHRQLANVYERLGRGESAQREWNLYLAQALRDPARGVGLEQRRKLRLIQIESPAQGTVLSSNVEVRGSAYSDDFDYYKLEFGIGASPTEWNVIGPLVYEPVMDGVLLGTWDTSVLPDGEYSLRVVVVNKSGNTLPAYQVTVTIKH
ncbi:MAG: hypothetical protein C4311_15370, partial [Chloroflexota bacterium]